MKELLKQVEDALKDRPLEDGDRTIDQETLRLMELRVRMELCDQIEFLRNGVRELKELLRARL
jgi:hypothetical protein